MSAVYEKEKLAYRLLDGETAKRLERPGASLRYSVLPCSGEKAGTVIFLHGVASNGSRWEEFIEGTSLRKAFDILRCDLRGHAASVSSRQARLEDWCGDVEAILQAESVAKAIVVGHSLGAQVAVNFAARYADRVCGVVLLDPLISEALTPKALQMRAKLPYLKVMERFCRLGNALGFSRRLQNQDLRAMDAKAREKIAAGGKAVDVRPLLDEPVFVHQSTLIAEVLPELSSRKANLAIVTDNYGGTLGIVTVEDIVEELVGEIWDEDDVVEESFVPLGGGRYEVDAEMTVGEVFDRLDYTDPEDDEELRYKLLGEWTYEQFSYIPREREGFRYHRLDVRISDMKQKRIVKLVVRLLPEETDEAAPADAAPEKGGEPA